MERSRSMPNIQSAHQGAVELVSAALYDRSTTPVSSCPHGGGHLEHGQLSDSMLIAGSHNIEFTRWLDCPSSATNHWSTENSLDYCFSELHSGTSPKRIRLLAPEDVSEGLHAIVKKCKPHESSELPTVEKAVATQVSAMEGVGIWGISKKKYNGLEEIFANQPIVNQGLGESCLAHIPSEAPFPGSLLSTAHEEMNVFNANEHVSVQKETYVRTESINEGPLQLSAGPSSVKSNAETEREMTGEYQLTSLPELSAMTENDDDEIWLVQLLISSAQAVASEDINLASVILAQLRDLVSRSGSTVNRVAAYFSGGLERGIEGNQHDLQQYGAKFAYSKSDILAAFQILHEVSPYIKFGHFTANQAILEAIQGESQVHIVDFDIMEGIQWPAFMQALVTRKDGPPHVRMTALYRPYKTIVRGNGLALVQETGKRLTEFASSLNVPFTFDVLKVEREEEELAIQHLKLVKGEALVVNCMLHLPHMPHHHTAASVSSFMQGIRQLSPLVLTVVEEELGCNTRSVASYFFEALHHYTALSNSLEACLADEVAALTLVESVFFQPKIDSAIALWTRSYKSNASLAVVGGASAELADYKWRSLAQLAGFRNLPMSSQNFSQARLLLGLYRDGFKLDRRSNRLHLEWCCKHLFAASVWN